MVIILEPNDLNCNEIYRESGDGNAIVSLQRLLILADLESTSVEIVYNYVPILIIGHSHMYCALFPTFTILRNDEPQVY